MSRVSDEINQWLDENPGVNPLAETGGNDVLVEIRDLLRSIDAKLSPPLTKKGKHVKLGRVFSASQIIPDDVDLVAGASNLRWKRAYDDMQVPLDQWYPREGDGPVVSGNVLIAQNGHVTEIPAPGSEAQ